MVVSLPDCGADRRGTAVHVALESLAELPTNDQACLNPKCTKIDLSQPHAGSN
jgi:hypothetical protein